MSLRSIGVQVPITGDGPYTVQQARKWLQPFGFDLRREYIARKNCLKPGRYILAQDPAVGGEVGHARGLILLNSIARYNAAR